MCGGPCGRKLAFMLTTALDRTSFLDVDSDLNAALLERCRAAGLGWGQERYLDVDWVPILIFSFLVVVLVIRPAGLFGVRNLRTV